MLLVYIITYFLFTDGTIDGRKFKLYWNLILIIASSIVAITGILMVIYVNLDLLPIDNTIIFWHVEFGILTTITGIFHVHMHWESLKKIF